MQNEEVLKYVYNLCQKEDGYTAAHLQMRNSRK